MDPNPKKRCHHDYLIRVRWKGEETFMWTVTWAYIVNNVVSHPYPKRKYKRKAKKGRGPKRSDR